MHGSPPRLVDDPAVSSSLREDMARAGQQHHAYAAAYDAASKAGLFQAVLASSGGGAAVGLGVAAKVAIGTVGAAALMFAGAALHARFQAPTEPSAQHGVAPVFVAPAVAAPAVPAAPAIEAQRIAAAVAAHVAAPAQSERSPARRVERDGTLQEVRQLARVRAYLQSGDAANALQLAERGHRELGQSALWQEREALAVLALFDLERTEDAEQRSSGLLARFPNSPFRAELEHRLRQAHAR